MQIIVARYNEDITWTKSFNNLIIYNKGNPIDESYNQIILDNVGREGHTYYTHIYNNYDNLDDYIVFLQGNPFDHSPNIIHNLNHYINNKPNIDFEYLSENIIKTKFDGCPYHPNLPFKEVFEVLFNDNIDNMSNKFANEVPFGAGAQFIVSKKKILSRSKDFYLKIVNLLGYSNNPIEGFVIERFHYLIFDNLEDYLPPDFNIDVYRTCNSDLINLTNYQLLHHWKVSGCNENRIYKKPSNFNYDFYRNLYHDLKDLNDIQLLWHWYNFGIIENRANPFF